MDADSTRQAVTDEDPLELLASNDAEDRAFGAFLLGSAAHTAEVHAALRQCLNDASPEVVNFAAQSLAQHGDVPVVEELLSIVEGQSGRDLNPVPWAVAVLGRNGDEQLRNRVRQTLLRLRERGSPEVVRQVDILLGTR